MRGRCFPYLCSLVPLYCHALHIALSHECHVIASLHSTPALAAGASAGTHPGASVMTQLATVHMASGMMMGGADYAASVLPAGTNPAGAGRRYGHHHEAKTEEQNSEEHSSMAGY